MKGILMTPDNIRAIEEDRKTVTRRVIKPQPVLDASGYYWNFYTRDGGRIRATLPEGTDTALAKYAPYHVGEVVYIKEAGVWDIKTNFRAYKGNMPDIKAKWQSPLFMPAWAARYFLKITDIRAERLQEITPEDCYKEGCQRIYKGEALSWYQDLWDSINPEYPWYGNWWVFRNEFIKVEKP